MRALIFDSYSYFTPIPTAALCIGFVCGLPAAMAPHRIASDAKVTRNDEK